MLRFVCHWVITLPARVLMEIPAMLARVQISRFFPQEPVSCRNLRNSPRLMASPRPKSRFCSQCAGGGVADDWADAREGIVPVAGLAGMSAGTGG